MWLLHIRRPDQDERIARSERVAEEAEARADELLEKAVRAAMLRAQVDAETGRTRFREREQWPTT